MSDQLSFDYYISAMNESSRRTMATMNLLLIASVVVFCAYWNVRPDGWTAARIEIAEDVVKWFGWNPQTRSRLSPPEQKRFDDAKHFADLFGLTTKTLAEDEIKTQTAIYHGHTFIKIPIFNVDFDVSDLGMLGGFAFVNILIMLRLSLARELANLSLTFAEARQRQQLDAIYDILSMRQVFTVPPQRGDAPGRIWTKVHRALLFIPLALQFFVFRNDWQTKEYGWAISPWNTVLQLGAGVAFLALIALLTFFCFKTWLLYETEWSRQAKQLGEATENEPLGAL